MMNSNKKPFFSVLVLVLSLFFTFTITAHAQHQGIWKDDAPTPTHSFYIQHYSTGSTVVIYTADAVTLFAFQDVMAGGVFEADSLDAQKARTLRIEFVSDDSGMAFLTDNGPEPAPPIEVQIIKAFPAVRTQQSGIWKDGGNQISVYIQLYETGSSVIVYTFDGSAFQVFLGDITLGIFNQLNLADQTEKLLMEFLGPDTAACEALPAVQAAYLPSANSFYYILEKLFFPMPLDVDFEGNPRSGTAPLTVQFNDISALMHTDWFWDFGDSGTSTAKDPQHTYNDPGMYTVIMGASDGIIGTSSLYTDYIEVLSSGGTTATISGIVVEDSAPFNPISGVTVTFTNGGGTATTDASGNYSIQLPSGWSGDSSASKTGCSFLPTTFSYSNVTTDQLDQNFEGNCSGAPGPTISGHVAGPLMGTDLSGVTVTFSNGGGSAVTDGNGNYTHGVPSGWSGTATPSLSGYVFTPPSISFTNVTADQTNQDYASAFQAFITYFISGHVAGPLMGTDLSGVTVTFSNGGGSAVTDGNGNYTHGVPSGWSGTATPSLSGYVFTPSSISYTNVTADQTNRDYASAFQAFITYFISGHVAGPLMGTDLSGVTVTFSNGGGSAVTDGNGNYTHGVPSGWSGTATPSLSGYVFTPSSISYTNVTADQTNQDYASAFQAFIFRYISGRIVEASAPFSPIPGVAVTFSGSGGGTTTTDSNGDYTFGVPSGWSGTATPSKSGRAFLPASRPYNNVTADIGNENYEGQ